MTDRELLELAAKAAGIKEPFVQDMRGWGEVRHGFSEAIYDDERGEYWNPLTDDGDALRLAVKLGLFGDAGMTFQFMEAADSAATRCAIVRAAIVRAAAEIGKAM